MNALESIILLASPVLATSPPSGKEGATAKTVDDSIDLAQAKFDTGNPRTAAKYLHNIYFQLLFAKGYRITNGKKPQLAKLTISVIKNLYAKKEYRKVLTLLGDLYQAELTGMISLTEAQKAKLGSVVIPVKEFFTEMPDYMARFDTAIEGLNHAFTWKNRLHVGVGDGIGYRHEVDSAAFVMAVIDVESKGNTLAVNGSTGCSGMMQLHPQTAKTMATLNGFKDYAVTDPRDNIVLGTAYLRFLSARLQGFYPEVGRDTLLILSAFSYASSGGENSREVKDLVQRLKDGQPINWFGFKNSDPKAYHVYGNRFHHNGKKKIGGRWRYIVRVMGRYKAYQEHINFCDGNILHPPYAAYPNFMTPVKSPYVASK